MMKDGIVQTAAAIPPGAYAGWCVGADHLAPVDPETGLVQSHPSMPPLRDICFGAGKAPLPIARPFFQPGRTYRHEHEGAFEVVTVGMPPQGVEAPGEMLGVAFGWRTCVGAGFDGAEAVQPLGSYTTSDFYGWSEVVE
ncbi:hypothetical protein ACFQ6C_25910 [Streptomyces sp. NPDC056454]|uniref:hypothetical protein n=1 Tax=Streptomyces sp. NPDC056454 TaxID=3345823 RepID=UPI0036A3A785